MFAIAAISDTGNDAIWIAAVIGAAGTILAAAGWVLTWLVRLVIGTNRFIKDWNGSPADATRGDAAQPGVLVRLSEMERRQRLIEHTLTPNGGASLADAVHRIDRRSDVQAKLLQAHLEDGEYLLQVGIENDKAEREALAQAGIVYPYTEVQYESLRATRALREMLEKPSGEA